MIVSRSTNPELSGGALRAATRGGHHRGHQPRARPQPLAPRGGGAHQALRHHRHAHRAAAGDQARLTKALL